VNFGVTVESVEAARETPPESCSTSTPIAGSASRTLRPTVRLRTGEVLHADIILGADGRRSMVRRVVTGEEPDTTSYGISRYTGSVPITEVRKHAALKQLVDVGSSWPIWFGDMRGALGTPSSFYLGNGHSFC
jgi:2-polyprenyl-6-methoxyphenol hydroxylase-like FAD-dependent oxidoreductase